MLAQKSDKPLEAYHEIVSSVDDAQDYVPIDDLPNKDWLRAT